MRLISVLAAGTLLIGSGLIVRGGDITGVAVDDPRFAGIRAVMESIDASDADIEAVAGVASVPGNVEFLRAFGQSGAAGQPDVIDPLLTVTAELLIDDVAALAVPGGPFAAGEGRLGTVAYGQGLATPSGSEWYLYAKSFAVPCGPRNAAQEFGVVAVDITPLEGGNPEPVDSGPTSNLFYGINTAYVLHADPNQPFSAVRYERGQPGAQLEFITTDSGWIGICTGNTIIGLIPGVEWDGITEFRFFAFDLPFTNNGEASTRDATQMRFPGIDQDAIPADENIIEIDVGPEAPASTDTPIPTDTPAPVATATPAATATAVAVGPTTGASAPVSTPVRPTPAATPTTPSTPTGAGGIDPLILLALAGAGLIALAVALWLVSHRDDCDELGRLAKAARDACDRAHRAAEEARARHQKAVADREAAEAYERAARNNLADAEARLAAAKARAAAPGSDDYVEGEPYGRLTADDLALQNEANARARAEANAAKADARAAWQAAGSTQGEGTAALDDQLSAIEKAAQDEMARNNDPANIGKLRKEAAERAAAEMGKLQAEVDAARQSLDDATASLRNASETESVTRAEWQAAEANAERICNEAAAAQKAYDDCVGRKSQAAQVKPKQPPPPPPGGTSTGGSVGVGGTGTTSGPGTGTTGTTGTTPTGNPPARPCSEGEESWEPVGPARSFTIRADGARTRVILWTDPGIEGLEEWIDESASAGQRESGEHHPSITSAEIDFITPARLTEWLRGLGGSKGLAAPNMTLHFEIKRKSRTVQCERRWVCRDGAWRPGETRATITDRPLPPDRLNQGPVTPSIQKVQGFLTRVKALIDSLKEQEEEAEKAGRCE